MRMRWERRRDRGRVVWEGEGLNWAGRINPACENTRGLSWCLWGILGCKVEACMKTRAFVPQGPQSPCRCTISPPPVPSFFLLSATRSDFQFLQRRGLMLASGPLHILSLPLECSFLACFLGLSLDVVGALRSFCHLTSGWVSWAEDGSLGVCRWGWSQTWRRTLHVTTDQRAARKRATLRQNQQRWAAAVHQNPLQAPTVMHS